MGIHTGKTMAFSAVSGMIAGIACGGNTPAPEVPSVSTDAPTSAAEAAATGAKDCCKGKNECKGKGACKTDKNDCKGKNECKGQGGCKAADCATP